MKIKMILSDMDGTLVSYPNKPFNSTWDVFPEILSEQNKKEWFRLRDFYLKKKGRYNEWFNKQVNLLSGLSVEKVNQAFFPIPYSRGAESFFNSLNGEYVKGIVSSGIGFVAEKIKKDLKFNFQSSSNLETKARKFTGKGKMNFDLFEKDKMIINLSKKYKINLKEICYVGDAFNDLPVFEIVGLAVAFNPKEKELEKKADYVIYDFNELKEILK